jgi:hypothetical protein
MDLGLSGAAAVVAGGTKGVRKRKMKQKTGNGNGKPEIGPDRFSFTVCGFRFPVSSFLSVLVPARPG